MPERPRSCFFVNGLGSILPFVLIALVFWLLIVRPQRRRQQELKNTQSSIGPGTEVMLGSGIFGTVVSVDEETLSLEVAPGTVVKVAKQAVIRVIAPEVAGVTDAAESTAISETPQATEATNETPPASDDPSDRHDQ
ncbi:MAG: preprotein translocase subunit YajC [Nocardioides sp.]